ncbi:unnamed protein product [Effrenium voratum]|nr:unnamed protein product [Effrenium voratum]
MDTRSSLQQGAVGAIGSLPGTICAHPLDVVKIRLQTTDCGSHLTAARSIFYSKGLFGFYQGLMPALEQRFLSRGPMFLVSEVCTQQVSKHLACNELQARACGSSLSGYLVGFLQGLPEYRKKLLSQGVVTASDARWGRLCQEAYGAGLWRTGLLRRMHAAALCCSAFDGTFFCTRDLLLRHFSHPLAYGLAAAAAVLVAYPIDTAVSRMMIVPPRQPVARLRHYIFPDARAFRGLPARAGEFFISYAVTGTVEMLFLASR